MRNRLKRAIAALLCLTMSLSGLAACGKKKADTESTLEVIIWDAGYGVEWAKQMLNAFAQEDWVKDKYPALNILPLVSDTDASVVTGKMSAGERANTFDLILGNGGGLVRWEGTDSFGNEQCADLTDVVYNTLVPGENITVKDKMDDSYIESVWYYDKGKDSNDPNREFKAYGFPWCGGVSSLLYNKDYMDQLGAEIPKTTEELIALCKEISDGGTDLTYYSTDVKYAIMTHSTGGYWDYIYPTWWGQYEGISGYVDFCNGIAGEGAGRKVSADIHRQKGKQHTLEAMEQLLSWNNGYVYSKYTGLEFMGAQANFIRGDGMFYANGDWFANEMLSTIKEIEESGQTAHEIRMMPMPMISAFVEKCSSIWNAAVLGDGLLDDPGTGLPRTPRTWSDVYESAHDKSKGQAAENDREIIDKADEYLCAVIRAIDDRKCDSREAAMQAVFDDPEDNTRIATVSDDDFKLILANRGVIHSNGMTHRAIVPTYAKGKQVAFDFLRFLATDKAQEIYLRATGGASLPFEYNVKQKNFDLYNELLPIEKDRLDMIYDSAYDVQILPDPSTFPLMKWGEMTPIYSLSGRSLVLGLASEGTNLTAKSIFNGDINYYIDNGGFNTCRQKAYLD